MVSGHLHGVGEPTVIDTYRRENISEKDIEHTIDALLAAYAS